ncbi:hypothetical protein AOL_s00004g311 [Orbilia oligospora ATCC 24927]|uniref:Uncharacterized protein n=1 Tax=Arthrobotrys oligospora (strain ATCC 24927 / CBS 115.81 / DSM 1491) TaxID=756982 RepID=G1WYF1_ARTOA|nr:hypothetical protein AOL_s00004g311 [Orbilia oligospora ATCC 24927]EGX54278.1 hypothetical protein AOL_s00004g311 [Orbilia oligospora ATCC 24927]
MPGNNRLLIAAVSSLLMSSAFAGAVYPRDLKTGSTSNDGIAPRYQDSSSNTPNTLSTAARFPRYKRQEVALEEGTVVALSDTSPIEETTEEIIESAETTTIIEEPHKDSPGSDVSGPPPGGRVLPPNDSQPAMGEEPLPVPPSGLSDDFAADAPPLMPDESGDPKDDAATAQQIIAESRKELEDDSPEMSQEELDNLATAVELISADLSKREDPATVNVEEQVKSQMGDWDSLSDAEKREAHEKALYNSATQDLQLTAVVGNLVGITEKIVNGDVKTNATEGLVGIKSEDVPANSTVADGSVETGGSSARLRKRSLNKRFVLPGVLRLLGIGVDATIGLGFRSPLASVAVALTTGIGKATNAEPPKPQEKIVFVEREVQRQQPQQEFNQPFPQQSFRQESSHQFERPPIIQHESYQPQATVPGWDNIYRQNQGFGANGGGFTQTRPSWKKSRRRIR